MRITVPLFAGIWRRGPEVVSSARATIFAGASFVRHRSMEYQLGSSLLTCTKGAGPSDNTTARPRSSCPVTTRRICLLIVHSVPSYNCSGALLIDDTIAQAAEAVHL